jgi:hypothetical protein
VAVPLFKKQNFMMSEGKIKSWHPTKEYREFKKEWCQLSRDEMFTPDNIERK